MGKKYIVEIGRLERLYKAFVGAHGKPSLTWLSPEVDLTPYTEPDLERVRKEAYEQGRKDGKIEGQAEAWVCARKIACDRAHGGFNIDIKRHIFGSVDYAYILANYNASEVIEKIRQYDQGRITKGDVVRIKSAPEIEILVTYANGEYVGGIALTEVDDSCKIGDQFTDIVIYKVEKTGRHYEIAEVLRKMKEGS